MEQQLIRLYLWVCRAYDNCPDLRAQCMNWLIQRAGIQDASKVRSTDGLLVRCYGKLTVCCHWLLFNS